MHWDPRVFQIAEALEQRHGVIVILCCDASRPQLIHKDRIEAHRHVSILARMVYHHLEGYIQEGMVWLHEIGVGRDVLAQQCLGEVPEVEEVPVPMAIICRKHRIEVERLYPYPVSPQ